MSVVIETTIGDITVDLFIKERPNACLNFLKLCKVKYYNLCLFYKIEKNFIAQAGDPTATGRGGESIFSHLYGDQAKYFDAEFKPRLKHEKLGTLSMVNNGNNMNGSQFFLTLSENLTYLDENHTVFGEVAEGFDILLKLNDAICDNDNRPYQDIRITHTVVLHDPFDDPTGLEIPDASPEPTKEMLESGYIRPDEEIDDNKGKNAEEVEEKIKESEAKARATILEMVGDIPDADVKPPENVLFVCKLNPVTSSEDLEVIFSRFGKILSCEVIKDKKSGESLQYAFIEFEREEDCEAAYFKMDNVLIDDRRIHVDFSQSVSKLYFNRDKLPNSKFKPNFSIKDTKKNDGYDLIFETEDSIADDFSRKRKSNETTSKYKSSNKKNTSSFEDRRKLKTDRKEDSKYSYRNDKHAKYSKYSPDEESHRYRRSEYSYSPSRSKSEKNRSYSNKKDYPSYSEMSRYSKKERSHKYRDAEYSPPLDQNKYSDNKSKSKYSSHSVPQNYKEVDHHRRSSPKQKLHETFQRDRKDSVSPNRSKKTHKLREDIKMRNIEHHRTKSSTSKLKRKTSDRYHSSKKHKAKASRSSSVSSSTSSSSSSSSSSTSSTSASDSSSSSNSSSDLKYKKSRPSSQSKNKKKHHENTKEQSKSNKKKYKS